MARPGKERRVRARTCGRGDGGGGNRARTGDLLAASQTLSQLSYTPTGGPAAGRRRAHSIASPCEARQRRATTRGRLFRTVLASSSRHRVGSPGRVPGLPARSRCARLAARLAVARRERPAAGAGTTPRASTRGDHGQGRTLRPARRRGPVAGALARARRLSHARRRRPAQVLLPRLLPVPLRRRPLGRPLPQLRPHRRRLRATNACAASTCCTRWAGTPSACRPRTTPSRWACTRTSPPSATSPTTTARWTSSASAFDWSREITSSLPDYYRWTQWFFLLMYERGLAYRSVGQQWWCPSCKTILANEQVEQGALLALRQRGDQEGSRAVVLPHHRLRPAAARRPRDDRLAREDQAHADQLDRAQRGRRGRLQGRRARRDR